MNKLRRDVKQCYYLSEMLVLASFFILTLFASQHLFREGYVIIKSPDFYFHYNRFLGVIESLSAHQGFPKINHLFLEGWGYSAPMFYGDYLFIIGFIYYKLGFLALTSYKLYLMTLTFLCLIITYYCLRPIVKHKQTAYLIAVMYTLAPFRFYDLFVRNALGEATAFLFLPLVFLGMWSIRTETKKRWWYLTLGMSGLLLTHLLSTILVVVLLAVIVIIDNKAFLRNVNAFIALAEATIMTLGLTAFFSMPMLEQLLNVKMRINTDPIPQKSMFLSGFGKLVEQSLNNISLYSANIGIILLLSIILKFFVKKSEMNSRQLKIADYAWVIGILTLVVSTSLFPWDFMFDHTFLSVIQFPYRWLIITTMMLSISGGIYFYQWSNQFMKPQKAFMILMAMIMILTLSYSQTLSRAEGEQVVTNTAYRPYQIGTGQEYLPMSADLKWLQENAGQLRYDDEKITINNLKIKQTGITFDYDQAEAAQVSIPLLNYPGYQVKNSETGETMPISTGDNYELLIPNVNGRGRIEVSYHGTPVQKISLIISALSLLVIGYRMIKYRKISNQ